MLSFYNAAQPGLPSVYTLLPFHSGVSFGSVNKFPRSRDLHSLVPLPEDILLSNKTKVMKGLKQTFKMLFSPF